MQAQETGLSRSSCCRYNTETAAHALTYTPQGASTEELAKTKSAYEAFLGEPSNLTAVREAQKVKLVFD
jgi:hypothetical protein